MRVFASRLSFAAMILAGSGGFALAAPDRLDVPAPAALSVISSNMSAPEIPAPEISADEINASRQLADFEVVSGRQPALDDEDQVLYSVLSDQIRQMRRQSALPAVMCLAESNSDGTARTVPPEVMDRLVADNAGDDLFTLKQGTECVSAGNRIVDVETHSRALLITAGPMEDDMKGLMSGCGDFVGGFVRAQDDSDYDFYAVNGGDVARKLGCELAQ